MIDVHVQSFSEPDWTALVAGWAGFGLTQDWAFGAAKAAGGEWTVERAVLRDGSAVVGAYQALVRRLPWGLGGLAWLNRGPVLAPSVAGDKAVFKAVLGALRRHFAVDGGMYLRLAPLWPAGDDFDAISQQSAYRPAGPLGWHSATLDLAPSEADLRAGLKQKWRNILNKAEKAGLDLVSGSDRDLFDAFVARHDAFVGDAGFETSVTGDLLAAVQARLPEARKMRVFQAARGGDVLGSVLTVRTGGRVEYLAGNSTDDGRKVGVGQLLLWRAVLAAREEGASHFDVGGLDPVLTPPGIFRFKSGLGAMPYALAPEVEAVPGGLLSGLTGRLIRHRVNRARNDTRADG